MFAPTSTFIIQTADQGQRLDKFLTQKIKSISRSEIQKMIKQGLVLINQKVVAPHYFLKLDDRITIEPLLRPKIEARAELETLAQQFKNYLVFEDQNFIVLNKPAGLAVHPAAGIKELTLVDYLLAYEPALSKIGEDPARPGLVQRLDKDVSGLMVVAKTQAAFDHLKKQFQERKIKKEYFALVYGEIKKNEGSIDLPIGRASSGKMAARAKTAREKSKPAFTEFEVIKRYKNLTLLRVKIKTGRTHQIRVHLLAFGHPVVGDQLYRPKNIKPIRINRLFLHSALLGFSDLAGHWLEFKSDLTEELNKFLKNYET